MASDSLTPPSNWKLIVDHETITKALSNLSTHIDKDYSANTTNLVILGVLTGAAYFTVDLSRKLNFTHEVKFLRVSSYHNSQTSGDTVEITGLSNKEVAHLSNKHVLILDELYDSGKTLDQVIFYLKQFNPLSIKTCVMFRKSKKSEHFNFTPPNYCGIDNLPDVWYVGYGLDDCGTKRQWNNLYAVPKSTGVPTNSDDLLFNDPDLYKSLLSDSVIISPRFF